MEILKILKIFIVIKLLGNLSTISTLDAQDAKYTKNIGQCYFDRLPNEKVYEIVGFVSGLSNILGQIKDNNIKKLKKLALINSRFQSIVNAILDSIQDATSTYLNKSEDPVCDAISLGTIFANKWLKSRAVIDDNLMTKINEVFFRAIELNQFDTVRFLLKSGANFDIQKSYQNTALTYSVCYSYKKIAKLLIEEGASLNTQNESGSTALIFAALNNNEEIVEFLLKAGADPNIKNKSNETALNLADFNNNQKIIELLLKHGAK